MRIAVCALSAVLLSGCSWMGMGGQGHHGGKHAVNSQYGAHHGGQYRAKHNPCQIMVPTQPIPRGCAPSQVTVAAPGNGAFPQQPNFSNRGYADGGYGSHANNAGQHAAHTSPQRRLKKPKWRGQMSLGLERSMSGTYLELAESGNLYQGSEFNQTIAPMVVPGGTHTSGTFTVDDATVTGTGPIISNDDAYRTPLRVAGGLEYIWKPRTTLFANAGYSYSSGESVDGFVYRGDVQSNGSTQAYDAAGVPTGAPTTTSQTFTDRRLADAQFQFSDMERIDLEVGARHYFDPILQSSTQRSISPFVGIAAGASHYNAQTATIGLDQLDYSTAGGTETYEAAATQVGIYGSQWIPSGQVNAGLEWQMTPKTALAFETGVRIEGGREYSNGQKSDSNVAIPFTIRGSYNF